VTRFLFYGKLMVEPTWGLLFTKGGCSGEEIMHDLWVERELRITAVEPTFVSQEEGSPWGTSELMLSTPIQLLIAWACVPAWSLWQAFGPQKVKNIEEGLVFPPLTTFASPIILLSLLTAFVASAISALSQIFLPATIRNTPPNEPAKQRIQQTMRTKTRVAYILQMTSCVLYQAVVSCSWVLDRSFSTLDLAPLVYMFAVTGLMWTTLILSPYHS